MRKQGNVKMEAAQKSLEAAQRDLILVEKERQEGMARIDSGEAEVKAIEQNIKSDKEKMEKEISDIICRYKEVEESILEHDAKLMHSIGCL